GNERPWTVSRLESRTLIVSFPPSSRATIMSNVRNGCLCCIQTTSVLPSCSRSLVGAFSLSTAFALVCPSPRAGSFFIFSLPSSVAMSVSRPLPNNRISVNSYPFDVFNPT
ncbi:unnamed protein product, partial [Sphacelaria rigidula]